MNPAGKLLLALPLGLLLLILPGQQAIAQQGNGTLAGVVRSSSGRPVAGARVFLQAADGKKPQTEVTDSTGRFIFAQLPPGLYEVRAQSKGQWTEWQHNIEVKVGRQTNVRLRLRPKQKPAKS